MLMLADNLLAMLSLRTTEHIITAVCTGMLAIYLTLVVIQACQYFNYRLSNYPTFIDVIIPVILSLAKWYSCCAFSMDSRVLS